MPTNIFFSSLQKHYTKKFPSTTAFPQFSSFKIKEEGKDQTLQLCDRLMDYQSKLIDLQHNKVR